MSDINFGAITEALNDKVDLPTPSTSQEEVDFVVEWKAPTEADPTWYRKYKSGWLEQGGITASGLTGIQDVVFLKPYAEVPHVTGNSFSSSSDSTSHRAAGIVNSDLTTTGFKVYLVSSARKFWRAEGQGAE